MKFFASRLAAIAAGLIALSAPVVAQQSPATTEIYPDKPIRIIVPWVAGGGTDIVARVVAQRLSERLGVPVIVENRPGANGIIGAAFAAKAAPDGYTLVLHAVDNVINPSINNNLPYDTLKDFVGVSEVGTQPLVLVIRPSMDAKTVKDLVSLAKANPDSLTYASWGVGSLGQLTGELFKIMAGIQIRNIPYQSGPQAVNDILGSRLDLIFNTMPATVPLIKAGKLKAIAVTSKTRAQILPNVPTMIESGFPGFEVQSWRGIYVPAGTPKSIITKLNTEFVAILDEKAVKERLIELGFDPVTSTPEELDALTRSELTNWEKVVKQAGIHQ